MGVRSRSKGWMRAKLLGLVLWLAERAREGRWDYPVPPGDPQGWHELEALLHELAEPLSPGEVAKVVRGLRRLIQTRQPEQGRVKATTEEALYFAIVDACMEVRNIWWNRMTDDLPPKMIVEIARLETLVEIYARHAGETL